MKVAAKGPKYKVGQKLYSVCIHEDGKCEMETHIITTIQNRKRSQYLDGTHQYVYAVQYIHGITWIKLSKKHGDFGWAKDVNLYRSFAVEGKPFSSLHTTKRQAWLAAKKQVLRYIGYHDDEYPEKEKAEDFKVLKTIERNIKLCSKK
jgi:hypothetical protein